MIKPPIFNFQLQITENVQKHIFIGVMNDKVIANNYKETKMGDEDYKS